MMNQFPLTQEDINDYLEFQNFKKMKQLQQLKSVAATQLGNLANQSNFNNLFNNIPGNSFSHPSSSIFPNATTSAATVNSTLYNNPAFYSQPPIISKVLPPPQNMPGMPLQSMQFMRPQQPQPAAAQSFMNQQQKYAPVYALKGGASNYSQTASNHHHMLNQIPPAAMPIQSMTQKVSTPKTIPIITSPPLTPIQKRRAPSPEIIVDDDRPRSCVVVPEKKMRDEEYHKVQHTAKTESFMPTLSSPNTENGNVYNNTTTSSTSIISLPSIDNSHGHSLVTSTTTPQQSSSLISSSSSSSRTNNIIQPLSSDSPDETHIIITARPRISYSAEREDTYNTSEEDSDYDTNLRPKETPLQYKERMMERVMDKAKRKNEASKRSREKRKREHHDRQVEKQRLERRNNELTEKLYNLREALKKLRPQICQSCNEQVQKFLDQCQTSKEGMNVFVLRPCKQDKCPGNKSVGKELGKLYKRD